MPQVEMTVVFTADDGAIHWGYARSEHIVIPLKDAEKGTLDGEGALLQAAAKLLSFFPEAEESIREQIKRDLPTMKLAELEIEREGEGKR